MIILQILIGLFFAVGIGYILADLLKVPSMKATKAASNLGRKGDKKTSTIEIYLKEFSLKLAEKLKMNEYKRAQLEADLKTAQMDITPEKFKANAIVKALLIGIFAIPMAFIFPILSPVVLFLAVFLYRRELKSVSVRIRHKREKI